MIFKFYQAGSTVDIHVQDVTVLAKETLKILKLKLTWVVFDEECVLDLDLLLFIGHEVFSVLVKGNIELIWANLHAV